MAYYSETAILDLGASEILGNFSTLYPYLCLIAYQNNFSDPFDPLVVEAYWLGNQLLEKVRIKSYADHLIDKMELKKKSPGELKRLVNFFPRSPKPHHSFHVLAVWRRTGHLNIPHTLETMDACLINWGKIIAFNEDGTIKVTTQKLEDVAGKLHLTKKITRNIKYQGKSDALKSDLVKGDYLSYHWGYFCQKLEVRQLINLKYYTNLSLQVINS